MRMVGMAPPLGGTTPSLTDVTSWPRNSWVASSMRLIPPQGTWATRVVWRACLSHTRTQCCGIVGHSWLADTAIAQRRWPSCEQGHGALHIARGRNSKGPHIYQRGGKAMSRNQTSPASLVPKSKKGPSSAPLVPKWWRMGPMQYHSDYGHAQLDQKSSMLRIRTIIPGYAKTK
jgi:hypothetical protein